MKNIVIINQHTSNHGDEAAGIALIRGLKLISNYKISILYSWHEKISDISRIGSFEFKDIKHFSYNIGKWEGLLIRLSIFFPNLATIFSKLSTPLREQTSIISKGDLIINGPGGVNLGPYKDYYYLWRLLIAYKLNKDIAIYSISFGPFDNTPKIFKKMSLEILSKVKFLSLRDDKSQGFADDMSISYLPSIDTAFLSLNNKNLPKEYDYLDSEKYIVLVPNELTSWHPYFKQMQHSEFKKLYITIAKSFLNNYEGFIVLLPQLYGNQNDFKYMNDIKNEINSERLVLINPNYDSDIQQKIIKGSEFVVGARYHTIIFSINNEIPFFALSYEHKMANMLSLLNLDKYKLDLLEYFETNDLMGYEEISNNIQHIFNERKIIQLEVVEARKRAVFLAKGTFKELQNRFL